MFCNGIARFTAEHAKEERRQPQKHPFWLTLACIMLSFVVASGAIAVIFIPELQSFFVFSTEDYIYYASLFVAGCLCAVFPRIFFPTLFVLYVALSVFTVVLLNKSFALQRGAIPVSVTGTAVSISTIPSTEFAVSPKPNDSISLWFTVYTLPDKLLVPLPRTWYRVAGASVANRISASEDHASAPNVATSSPAADALSPSAESDSSFTPPAESLLPDNSQRASAVAFYYNYLFSLQTVASASLPSSSIYPALYTVTSSRHLSEISFAAVRSF